MRCLVSWLGASCVGFVAASLCHSQQVQAQLINLGAHIDLSTRLVAMADDLVGQRMSLYSFAANLRTVETQDRMLGSLLDTQA